MKKYMCILLVFLILLTCGCASFQKIKITNAEISSTGSHKVIKFTAINNTKKSISDFTLDIDLIDSQGEEIKTTQVSYPIEIGPGQGATLSTQSDDDVVSARAAACHYKNSSGKEIDLTFKQLYIAEYNPKDTKQESGTIKTREEAAEIIIKDVKLQFLKKKYMTDGTYDPEKKQLMIASYCDLTLNECKASFAVNPDEWNELSQSIASMSETCLDEFKSYGFDDVHVSIGFMSKDDKIVISAADGEIIDSLS